MAHHTGGMASRSGERRWRAALAVYDLLAGAAVATALRPAELLLRRLGRASPGDLAERLGRTAPLPRRSHRPRLLIHAVSLGEMRAAAALVWALAAADPAVEVVLSAGNRDARAAAERLRASYQQVLAVRLLPWDRAAAMRGWLAACRPDAVAVVESEIWPWLFVACRELGLPLALVSGRLAPADVWRYRLARGFFSRVLGCAAWIAVQSEAERRRFLRIGAPPDRLLVLGDLKSGAASPPPAATGPTAAASSTAGSRGPSAASGKWAAWTAAQDGEPPLLVAGSTHAPEERWLLRAMAALRRDPQPPCSLPPRLLLAPRRPGRAAAICRLALRHGLRPRRFGAGPGDAWDVLVLDELGPLAQLYAAGTLAFVGGTLSRHGGHTPLEAAASGLPLLAGPHTAHIAEVAAALERRGALLRLRTGRELPAAWGALLADPARRQRMGEAALAMVAAGRDTAKDYARALLAGSPPAAKHAASSRLP